MKEALLIWTGITVFALLAVLVGVLFCLGPKDGPRPTGQDIDPYDTEGEPQ